MGAAITGSSPPERAARWSLALPALVVTGAVGFWLGLHGLRSFLSMVVWNVGEDMAASQMGLIAAGLYAIGLIGWLPTRILGGRRPAWRFGLWLALATLLRQAFSGEMLTPAFSFATGILWLWWLPAFLQELVRRGALGAAVPAMVLGLLAQVVGQSALHGLDVPQLQGTGAMLWAALQVGLFLAALWLTGKEPALPPAAADGGESGAAWGAITLGPYLFLQMTLLANLGRVQMLSGWDLTLSAGLVAGGLILSLLALLLSPSWLFRLILGLLAVGLTLPGEWMANHWIWLMLPLQVALTLGLAAAFAPAIHPLARATTPGRSAQLPAHPLRELPKGRIYAGVVLGAVLLFALLFLFYSSYGWFDLWPVAAALVALPGLRGLQTRVPRAPLVVALVLAVLAAGLPLGYDYMTPPRVRPGTDWAPTELKILNYNIHNGFDYYSVPAMEEIGEVIAAADADLVALQEVNRGWNLSGGVDMVAWLRWRFPEYHVIYGPMNGTLWGNVIMSRYPVLEWGTLQFPIRVNDFPRGLVWAKVQTDAGELLFVSTHLTAYAGFDADRAAQAGDLLEWWQGRRRTVVAGDFNAHPDDEAIQRVRAGGLREVTASFGLGEAFTYSAGNPFERIDYIFTSPDVEHLAGSIPRTLASDHLPVAATVRIK